MDVASRTIRTTMKSFTIANGTLIVVGDWTVTFDSAMKASWIHQDMLFRCRPLRLPIRLRLATVTAAATAVTAAAITVTAAATAVIAAVIDVSNHDRYNQ